MASKKSLIYLECQESWYPFHYDSTIVPKNAKSINVVMPVARCFAWKSIKFGNVRKQDNWAEAMQKALAVIGKIVPEMDTYVPKVVQMDGALFPRVVCALFRISNPAGETVAWFLRIFWNEGTDAAEDGDVEEYKPDAKAKIIASRKSQRNPDHRLAKLFSKDEERKHRNDEGALWFERLRATQSTWTSLVAWPLYPSSVAGEAAHNMSFKDGQNPTCLGNLFTLDRAMSEMEAAGAADAFCDIKCWQYNQFGPPEAARDVWRINPQQLSYDIFSRALFPDRQRPDVLVNSPEYKMRFEQTHAELFRKHRKQFDDALMDRCREECALLAQKIVRRVMTGQSTEFTETASIENLRKAIDQAMKDADKAAVDALSLEDRQDRSKVIKARATARYKTQVKMTNLLEVFVNDDTVVPHSWAAIFKYIEGRLDDPENKNKNFAQPDYDVKEFCNLSQMGAMLARFLLEEESFGETYSVHRQFLITYLAALHAMIKASMPCHLLFIGQHSSSKSRVMDQLVKALVAGTSMKLQGSSEKAAMTQETRDINHKVVLKEEVPPSILGIEGSNSKKNGRDSQAMTDVASRHRAITTSNDVGWERLEKNEFGKFERQVIQTSLVQTHISAANITAQELPPNQRSRYCIVEFNPQERAGNYRITSRVLDPLGKQHKPGQEAYYNKLRDIHALHSVFGMMLNVGLIKIDDTAARGFVDEVLQLGADRGLPNVNEIRHVLRDLMLGQTLSVMSSISQLFISSKSPMATKKFDIRDMFALEKMCTVSIEAAVFALTLLSEQYENTSAASSAVLHAINLTFDSSPFHAAAESYEAKRSGKGSADDDNEGYSESKVSERKGGVADIRNHVDPPDVVKFLLLGVGGDNKNNVQHDITRQRCEKLYEAIVPKLSGRLNKFAVIDYLEGLTKIQVSQSDGKFRPGLAIDETGAVGIARSLLQNPMRNRLIGCVKEVLCRKHMPIQTYVLGVPSNNAPFIWQTFYNGPERDLHPSKADYDDYVHMKAEGDKLLAADGKLYAFYPARQEQLIWDILEASQEQKDPEKWFENHMSTYLCDPNRRFKGTICEINMDREDAACAEFFSQQVLFTPTVCTMMGVWHSPASLQPSARRQVYQHSQDELRKRVLARAPNMCIKYPDAFVSRNNDAYKKQVMNVAKKEPKALSHSARQSSDLAGLGFNFGDGKDAAAQRKSLSTEKWQKDRREAQAAFGGLLGEARKIVDDAKTLSRLQELFADICNTVKTCEHEDFPEMFAPDMIEVEQELLQAVERVKESSIALEEKKKRKAPAPMVVAVERQRPAFVANVFGNLASLFEAAEEEEEQQPQEPKTKKAKQEQPQRSEAEDEGDSDYVDGTEDDGEEEAGMDPGPQNSEDELNDLMDNEAMSDNDDKAEKGKTYAEMDEGHDSEEEDEKAGRDRPPGEDEVEEATSDMELQEEAESAKQAKMDEAADKKHDALHHDEDEDGNPKEPKKPKKKTKRGEKKLRLGGAAVTLDDA